MHPVPEIVEIFVVDKKNIDLRLKKIKFLLHFLLFTITTTTTFIILLSHCAEDFSSTRLAMTRDSAMDLAVNVIWKHDDILTTI